MTRDNGNRTKLSHRPRVAEYQAINQAPLDLWQCDARKNLPAICPQGHGRLLFFVALRLHERDQTPRDKGKGHEDCCQDNARLGENNLDVVYIHIR